MEQKKPVPARYLRECGHPNDWTLDLMNLDGMIDTYCMGCIVKKLGLKPIMRHKIIVNEQYPQGKLVEVK